MSDERVVLRRVLDEADAFLGGLDSRPVRPQVDVDAVAAALGGPLPEHPQDVLGVVEDLITGGGAGADGHAVGAVLRLGHGRRAAGRAGR